MAVCPGTSVSLNEEDIPGAKLNKNVTDMTKTDALRWLKCRGCRKLSQMNLQQLRDKVSLYIANGWDTMLLKDPDNGNNYERKRCLFLDPKELELEEILNSETKTNWTTSIANIPCITHSTVEDYFKLAGDKKHVTEGYAFSKTKKFETSGKPIQINTSSNHQHKFLLEGYTRPAMKQATKFSQGKGLYKCRIVFYSETGEILAAKDYSCPAGSRGFCKHIAGLAYKLVDVIMAGGKELPKPISCTETRQKWNVPSVKAMQDPEKEVMKRKPLQDIVFEKHISTRDVQGRRKRKLPSEVFNNYQSAPFGEPPIGKDDVEGLCKSLKRSKCSNVLVNVLEENIKCNKFLEDQNKTKENSVTSTAVQGSPEWFQQRIGKITGSKAPAVIGLLGRKEFSVTWNCIKSKIQEPPKNFINFKRGSQYEAEAAQSFTKATGISLYECGFMCKKTDSNYGASPDRTFKLCKDRCKVSDVVTGVMYNDCLEGLCLLEIKTRAEGNLEPLLTTTGTHVAQVQLQLECPETESCILQSYVPETEKSRHFLMKKSKQFITCFTNVCNAIMKCEEYNSQLVDGNKYAKKLHNILTGQIPTFENLLPLRQWANDIAHLSKEVSFNNID